jgi:Cof subfamily protein (haloacid dehalogenase superfamily)
MSERSTKFFNKRQNVSLPSGIQLVAIDLDGTLLDGSKELPGDAIHFFNEIRDSGLLISIVTGRNATSALELAHLLHLSGPHASSGGALVCGNGGHPVYARHPLSRSAVQQIVTICRRWNLTIFIHNSKQILMENGGRFLAQINKPHYPATPQPTHDILAELHFQPLKVTVYGDTADLTEALSDLNACQGCFEVTTAGEQDLEITACKVNKGSALHEISAITGISLNRIMAIGDSPNDISMFNEVGLAVAMGNASPEVKRNAKKVAPTNNEAGVLWAIQNLALANQPIV